MLETIGAIIAIAIGIIAVIIFLGMGLLLISGVEDFKDRGGL